MVRGLAAHPHTTPVVVTAYVKEFPDETLIKEKFSDGACRLAAGDCGWCCQRTKAFHPSQTVRGFELGSDVQIYLDLLRGGLRGEEQAEELRRWPDFAGGWV